MPDEINRTDPKRLFHKLRQRKQQNTVANRAGADYHRPSQPVECATLLFPYQFDNVFRH